MTTGTKTEWKELPAVTPARKKPSAKYKIPLIIHQSHKSRRMPARMWRHIQHIIALNPEFEHRYYDDEAMLAYINKHSAENFKTAFHKLEQITPFAYHAFQADLFRYLLLINEGGVWVDADCTAVTPLLEGAITPTDEHPLVYRDKRIFVPQCVIVSVPNHPILTTILDNAISKILDLQRVKDPDTLFRITGPDALKATVDKFVPLQADYTSITEATFEFENKTFTCRLVNSYGFAHLYDGYQTDLKLIGSAHYFSKPYRLFSSYTLHFLGRWALRTRMGRVGIVSWILKMIFLPVLRSFTRR